MTLINPFFQEYDQYGLCMETQDAVDLFVTIDLHNKNEIIPKTRQTVFTEVKDEHVFDSIMQQCRTIAENLNVHELVAFMILETQNWNVHRVFENWAQFHDSILESIGIRPDFVMMDPSLRHPIPQDGEEYMECGICFCECEPQDMWELQCGHCFCTECWRQHSKSYIEQGKHQVPCQMEGCRCKLPPNSVEMICGEEMYNNLLKFILNQQVSMADTLTNCPNPRCGKPVDVLTTGLCGVLKCSCGYEFCSECNEPSHAPATCAEKQFWEASTGDDVMQRRLFGENVKICPNCKSIIEKNGGCNHMTCYKCRYEFCWMCMQKWSEHPQNFYNCAAYRKEDDPFLKKPDNINREFLACYHDVFMKYHVSNKALKEKTEQYTRLINAKIVPEQGLSENEVNESIKNLLNLIYWTDENFKWAQVHMFNILYNEIRMKNIPLEQQMNVYNKPDQYFRNKADACEYALFKFTLESAMKTVGDIEAKITNIHTASTRIQFIDILKYTRKISVFRESLLKHCDPHYD